MVLDVQDEALVRQFHEELMRVMKAVNECNRHHRGRPLDVKKAFLKEKFPDQAEVALLMIQGRQSLAYQQVAAPLLAARYPKIVIMPLAALELA